MQTIINSILSALPKSIPKLPSKITVKDAQLLQSAIINNQSKKQVNLLRILLAQAYKVLGNQKCARIIIEINPMAFEGTSLGYESKLRVSALINETFDEAKIDIVKRYVNELTYNQELTFHPYNKHKFQIVKAGLQALKQNYYKSAVSYLNASKDQVIADDEQEKVNLIQKSIAMSLLAQKSHQLHQLICQLYVNVLAKKSPCYPLVAKLYSECMLDSKQLEPVKKLLPYKFEKKDSDNISLLNKVVFKHNMLPIIKCFDNISLSTLGQLVGVAGTDLLLMIQKCFANKEVEVDQVSEIVYIKPNPYRDQQLVKTFFDRLENLTVKNA